MRMTASSRRAHRNRPSSRRSRPVLRKPAARHAPPPAFGDCIETPRQADALVESTPIAIIHVTGTLGSPALTADDARFAAEFGADYKGGWIKFADAATGGWLRRYVQAEFTTAITGCYLLFVDGAFAAVHFVDSHASGWLSVAQVLLRSAEENAAVRSKALLDSFEPMVAGRRFSMLKAYLQPYSALGIHPGARREEVNRAYKKAIFDCHPDRLGGADATKTAAATAKSAEINAAFKELQRRNNW
jgi:hypothetical protein